MKTIHEYNPRINEWGHHHETHTLSFTEHVERLTPSLLAKAFRGELVGQDAEDESAERLVE